MRGQFVFMYKSARVVLHETDGTVYDHAGCFLPVHDVGQFAKQKPDGGGADDFPVHTVCRLKVDQVSKETPDPCAPAAVDQGRKHLRD